MTILKLVKAKLYHCPVIQSIEVLEANDVRLKGRLDASVNYFSANDYWQGNKIKLEALLNLLTQVLVSLYLWDTEMGWHVGHSAACLPQRSCIILQGVKNQSRSRMRHWRKWARVLIPLSVLA